MLCKDLIGRIYKFDEKKVKKVIHSLLKAKEVFGQEVYKATINSIVSELEESKGEAIESIFFDVFASAIEHILQEEADMNFYDLLSIIKFDDEDFRFTREELEDLDIDMDLKDKIIEKFNIFLGK